MSDTELDVPAAVFYAVVNNNTNTEDAEIEYWGNYSCGRNS